MLGNLLSFSEFVVKVPITEEIAQDVWRYCLGLFWEGLRGLNYLFILETVTD